MSERRLAAFEAISPVMPPVIKLVAGFVRSIAPMVNCVILLNAPVGVQDVSAIEFVQMTVSTKMSGRAKSARCQGTPKNEWVSQTDTKLMIGTPTNDTDSGSSM